MMPPGQVPRADFPRFGLPPYANRFPSRPDQRALRIRLPGTDGFVLRNALDGLPRTSMKADFHCVTTWSRLGLQWGGVRFADFFERRIVPALPASGAIVAAVLRGQDKYRTTLLLVDLIAEDVLIADELDGKPVGLAHGAPLRLLAPKHYGYKSVKHLSAVEFLDVAPNVQRGPMAFLDHPRARVALEERGRWFPGWLLRRLYRPLIGATVKRYRACQVEHERFGPDR